MDMDMVWLRDLIIIITGVIEILLLIIVGILAMVVVHRIKKVSKSVEKISDSVQEVVTSVKATTDNVASMSSFARSEMAEPLNVTADLLQGVLKGLNAVLGFFKKKDKKKTK